MKLKLNLGEMWTNNSNDGWMDKWTCKWINKTI